MKVIVIGGYPGSGKSTIVRGVIKRLESEGYVFALFKKGIVTWMESNRGLIFLGSYKEDETFPGTDRLPLNVQPEAQKFLERIRSENPDRIVLLEGDRLFNDKMITFLHNEEFELVLCIVEVQRGLLEQRRNNRSEQNETWRKGRETKVDRIAMVQPVQHHLLNNTKEEQEKSIQELLDEIAGKWKKEIIVSKIKNMWS